MSFLRTASRLAGALVLAALVVWMVHLSYTSKSAGVRPRDPALVKRVQINMGEVLESPLGLDPLPIPEGNPQTREKVALGRLLFFDPRLSVDGTISCASCHNPKLGWSNGLSVAFGVRGQIGKRSAPTVLNAAYSDTLFWDGRAGSLEEQARGPLMNPLEMANTSAGVVATLKAIPHYVKRFEQVFGRPEFGIDEVVAAIAAFERTLLSGNSPFDRYKYGGDTAALSASQVRGMELFRDKAGPNCAKCHRFDDFSADLTDFRFHNIGVGMDHPTPDTGRGAVSQNPEDRGRFRTPTLRNVALTAPYMHDGRFATLEQVLEFYMRGATSNPDLDPEIHRFELTPGQQADLLAFLESFTGTVGTPAGGGKRPPAADAGPAAPMPPPAAPPATPRATPPGAAPAARPAGNPPAGP
ncbi:MAG: c-type cytochrome [Nitrospirota bacterium]|nr:c-type cytochrome [Nitrospirota bacterium]